MSGQIKTVAFDLDNTIYSEIIYFNSIIKKCSQDLSYTDNDIKVFSSIYDSDSPDIFGDFLKKIKKYSKNNQKTLFLKYKYEQVRLNLSDLNLSSLNTYINHFKTCLLTNGVIEVQKNKVRSLNIENLFDKIFYARCKGVENEKPNPKAFQMICDHFNCEPSEVVFVGDHPINDIQGAKRFGMSTVWTSEFTTHRDIPPEADYHIRNLSELSNILGVA